MASGQFLKVQAGADCWLCARISTRFCQVVNHSHPTSFILGWAIKMDSKILHITANSAV